jgi:hypothetical protein
MVYSFLYVVFLSFQFYAAGFSRFYGDGNSNFLGKTIPDGSTPFAADIFPVYGEV